MPNHPIITITLLAIAVLLSILAAVGVATARDAYQRLQFSTPIATVASVLIAVGVWVEDSDWQARIKATLIAAVLLASGAIVNHAVARAIRIRAEREWDIAQSDRKALATEEAS